MTIKFNSSYIKDYYSLLGKNEHGITVKGDLLIDDYYYEKRSVEEAESEYVKKCIQGLLNKSKLKEKDINLFIGGDLQSELIASDFGMKNFNIPFLGVYSACSTFTESLLIASVFVENKRVKNVGVVTSSHNLVSEKQFRFPIEYGAIRKKVNTFTATGSVSSIVTNKKTNLKIESATIGSVVDIGYKDANNFGAVMAPAAAKTIYEHFKDTKRKPSYYDLILTGDLGIYGLDILKEYLEKEYKLKVDNLMDAGALLYKDTGSSIAGASGPTCLPLILFNKILKENKYKKILMVGTGALHSKTTVNIGLSIPSVSHAVSLEVISI